MPAEAAKEERARAPPKCDVIKLQLNNMHFLGTGLADWGSGCLFPHQLPIPLPTRMSVVVRGGRSPTRKGPLTIRHWLPPVGTASVSWKRRAVPRRATHSPREGKTEGTAEADDQNLKINDVRIKLVMIGA